MIKNFFIAASLLLMLTLQAHAKCEYEAQVRLGLIWHTVTVTSLERLSYRAAVKLLEKKYNFHDTGDIYVKCSKDDYYSKLR